MRLTLLLSLLMVFGTENILADDVDDVLSRFGPSPIYKNFPGPSNSGERFTRSYPSPSNSAEKYLHPSSFPSSPDSKERFTRSYTGPPSPPSPVGPRYHNRFPGTPDSSERFARSSSFSSGYPRSFPGDDSSERYTRSFRRPSSLLRSRSRYFGSGADSSERFPRSHPYATPPGSRYPFATYHPKVSPSFPSADSSSERFRRGFTGSSDFSPSDKYPLGPVKSHDDSKEKYKSSYSITPPKDLSPSYGFPGSKFPDSYPYPGIFPKPSSLDSDEKFKSTYPKPLAPAPPPYVDSDEKFRNSYSKPNPMESDERFRTVYPIRPPMDSSERFKRSYPDTPSFPTPSYANGPAPSNPRFPRSASAFDGPNSFESMPSRNFPTWSGRARREPGVRKGNSPLIDFPDGQEITDDDCIPNDGSDTGEGEQRSVPWQTSKDECYGVYSPRCRMFNRMTASYNKEQSESEDDNNVRRRRLAVPDSEYDPETDTYNTMPEETGSPASGLPRKRFRRDLLRSTMGFPSSSFPMGRFGSSMRAPMRRQTDPRSQPSSAMGPYESGTGTGTDPANPPDSTKRRVKCPERRVHPDYAYWKTRLPEDMRRSNILLSGKRVAAYQHNQDIMGRKR